jgi:hypothetical protein
MKILFILKQRCSYGPSYGLSNSCRFVAAALKDYSIESKIVEVIDTTFIDKEVHAYRPDVVVIEALWAESARLPAVFKLHPDVKLWTCRIHSKTGFLSHEGQALKLIREYTELSKEFPNFTVSGNNSDFVRDMLYSTGIKLDYLPNIYLFNEDINTPVDKYPNRIDIGCFGSLRPFKNQLLQAMAAIKFADDQGKTLRFHINGDRQEQSGGNVGKNISKLFEGHPTHKLIQHEWSSHKDFLKLVKSMDIGMQVSFNESYNIVAADFVSQSVPIVTSKEIEFILSLYQADVNSITDIVSKLKFAMTAKRFGIHNLNKILLNRSNDRAILDWLEYLYY